MESKSKNLTKDEAVKIIDTYFDKLGNQVVAYLKQSYPVKALTLKTADDLNLEFPEDIQESNQITEGTSPVKIDGIPADGSFVMPDGVTLEIKEGKVTKIIQPSVEQMAAMIRKDMADFKAQLKNVIVRKPFKTHAL